MDKMHIPPPTEMTWEFEHGGVHGHGENTYEGPVTVRYQDGVVTIGVGSSSVRLAEGSVGTQVGLAIYGAVSVSERT